MTEPSDERQVPSITDLWNESIANVRAGRADQVGQFVRTILAAVDPDAVCANLSRAFIQNQRHETRRLCVTMIAEALGVPRLEMKKWLRAKGICGPRD